MLTPEQMSQENRPNLKDGTLLREQCYVGGAWLGEGVTPVNDPATGALLARVPEFGAPRDAQGCRGGGLCLQTVGAGAPEKIAPRSFAPGST